MSAWDADDAGEGVNARISYSIEENAFHETTGEPIFSLEPQSGLVSTAVCCLDRETTPEYFLRVLATDGGGLQGKCVRARDSLEMRVANGGGDGNDDNF